MAQGGGISPLAPLGRDDRKGLSRDDRGGPVRMAGWGSVGMTESGAVVIPGLTGNLPEGHRGKLSTTQSIEKQDFC